MSLYPECKCSCQLHQKSYHEETLGAVPTRQPDQQLQVPASATMFLSTLQNIHTSCVLEPVKTHLLKAERPCAGDEVKIKKRRGKNKDRFIPCVCLFRGQPNHMQSITWHYPCGSFFFQLARTALACVRIGGSPKRCDISQYGTARLYGSFWRDD